MIGVKATTLFQSGSVTIRTVVCHARRGGDSGIERNDVTCVAIPLRGCYAVTWGKETVVADANTAILFDTRIPYRVSHPADGGDETLTVTCREGTFADAFPNGTPSAALLTPALQVRARALRRAIGAARDAIAVDEATMRLIEAIAWTDRTTLTRRLRHAVERAKAFMGERFRERLVLNDVAAFAGVSPFHLARAFPAATGMTLHRYLSALRHADAIEAIDAGASDLARVAVDAGFAHHSHFSKSFRRELGATPSALRAWLRENAPHTT